MTEPITDVKDETHIMTVFCVLTTDWVVNSKIICAQVASPEEMVPSKSLHLALGCCISYFVLL